MEKKVDDAAKTVPVMEKSVTDSEFDAAFQAALNSDVEEKVEVKDKPTPPSPDDLKGEDEKDETKLEPADKKLDDEDEHSEKSRLGRKFKRLEEDNQKLQEKFDLLLDTLSKKDTVVEDEDDIDDETTVITVKDVKKILEKHEANRSKRQTEDEKKATEVQQRYEKDYVKKILEFEDEPDFKVIYDEMYKNYNVKITGNPGADAEINFERATAAFYKKAKKEKKIPLKGGAPLSTGIESPNTKDEPSKKKIVLDEFASEYVQRLGIPEDKVQEWLSK